MGYVKLVPDGGATGMTYKGTVGGDTATLPNMTWDTLLSNLTVTQGVSSWNLGDLTQDAWYRVISEHAPVPETTAAPQKLGRNCKINDFIIITGGSVTWSANTQTWSTAEIPIQVIPAGNRTENIFVSATVS